MPTTIGRDVSSLCFHCGTPASEPGLEFDGKRFCCAGCKAVYQILSEGQLCRYYEFEQNPGNTPASRPTPRFEYLDDPVVARQLVDYEDATTAVATLLIPQMHCSSCIWLLENLHRLDAGVGVSRVDFLKKTLFVRFSKENTSLRKIVTLLSSLGYEPELNLGSVQKKPSASMNRSLYLKLGIAAFCFGNIMLFSLPEYFAGSRADFASRNLFGYINLILSLPVALYSSSLFYLAAWQGLRKKIMNIDVPITLGIAVVFVRSVVEVLAGSGPGYFDSLSGLVFFLLLGRLFQNKTYDGLNFERDFESYFPLAAAVRKNGMETTVPITSLRPGDRIITRNNEIIPADAVIMKGNAKIDYSYVTGESTPIVKQIGEMAYAGGKQTGSILELEVVKEVSQSKLVKLWNDFGESGGSKSRLLTLSATIGKFFTAGVLVVAAGAAAAWWVLDPTRILDAVTAVLIVSCPCALALAAPFAFGTTMRLFGNCGFYLKNTGVVETLSKVDTVVFDKTGTLTQTSLTSIRFVGDPLDAKSRNLIASLARCSTHPLSRSISDHLTGCEHTDIAGFEEIEGEGIRGIACGELVRLGSTQFVQGSEAADAGSTGPTRVYASIGNRQLGWFTFENQYRPGVGLVLSNIGRSRKLMVLSGDGVQERERLSEIYGGFSDMQFTQKPSDKLAFIKELQKTGRNVLMIGDGLNDAGALLVSDVAIAVSENVSTFSPACDAILDGAAFSRLDRLIDFSRSSMQVVYWSFALSILYNFAGLWFAVQGLLSPLLAAILMPLSSISVVIFSTSMTRILAKRKGVL